MQATIGWFGDAEPMLALLWRILQPTQRSALITFGAVPVDGGFHPRRPDRAQKVEMAPQPSS
jgi:hypothetical protein